MTTIIRNRSWSLTFTSYANATRYEANQPDDLSGYKASAQIRSSCHALIANLPVRIDVPNLGRITIDLTPEETAVLPLAQGFWDAILTSPDGRDYILQPLEAIRIVDQPTRSLSATAP